ncbi:hypothetical protein CRUP_016854 [Coryphaenoides rupestris]|nr:hypothetical protein CRUP_016854 [Coryphaenoides rupestris]
MNQFKKFHHEIVIELEKKTEMDVKYMNMVRTRVRGAPTASRLDDWETELDRLPSPRLPCGAWGSGLNMLARGLIWALSWGAGGGTRAWTFFWRRGSVSISINHSFETCFLSSGLIIVFPPLTWLLWATSGEGVRGSGVRGPWICVSTVSGTRATFKRYQSEHKVRQDSLERSQTDLKKLRRKSQGKNSSKYDIKENEIFSEGNSGHRAQMGQSSTSPVHGDHLVAADDIQRFMAEGCKEALVEEKRRFCFLVDKHCMLSAHIAAFHDKARELLAVKLPSWQEKCSDATRVPDTVLTQIQGPLTLTPARPAAGGPQQPSEWREHDDEA